MAEYIKREDVEKMIEEQSDLDDNDLRYIKQLVIDRLPRILYCPLCGRKLGKREEGEQKE